MSSISSLSSLSDPEPAGPDPVKTTPAVPTQPKSPKPDAKSDSLSDMSDMSDPDPEKEEEEKKEEKKEEKANPDTHTFMDDLMDSDEDEGDKYISGTAFLNAINGTPGVDGDAIQKCVVGIKSFLTKDGTGRVYHLQSLVDKIKQLSFADDIGTTFFERITADSTPLPATERNADGVSDDSDAPPKKKANTKAKGTGKKKEKQEDTLSDHDDGEDQKPVQNLDWIGDNVPASVDMVKAAASAVCSVKLSELQSAIPATPTGALLLTPMGNTAKVTLHRYKKEDTAAKNGSMRTVRPMHSLKNGRPGRGAPADNGGTISSHPLFMFAKNPGDFRGNWSTLFGEKAVGENGTVTSAKIRQIPSAAVLSDVLVNVARTDRVFSNRLKQIFVDENLSIDEKMKKVIGVIGTWSLGAFAKASTMNRVPGMSASLS